MSDYALMHSSEGGFVRTQVRSEGTVHLELRLATGGHSQRGMDLLDKYQIKYVIEKEFPNGVRLGYVENHKNKSKAKSMGQSWFPRGWTDKDIRRAGEHVAGLKKIEKCKMDGLYTEYTKVLM